MPEQLALDLGAEGVAVELGEVFTRRWVVELILDLAGYTKDRDLGALVAIEPACGDGAFLSSMVERLIESAAAHGRSIEDLAHCIQAFDLTKMNVERSRKSVAKQLTDAGVDLPAAEQLAQTWIRIDDFLLSETVVNAEFVIGNPPYIRLEHVPQARSAAYRKACSTMRGRSDVFVGFIERGLRMLEPDGTLAFIVADRWMHNEYGSGLRAVISEGFSIETVIEMHDVDAFEDSVSAYPAIVVIRNKKQGRPIFAHAGRDFDSRAAIEFTEWSRRGRARSFARGGSTASRLPGWFRGRGLWPSGSPQSLAVVAELEKRFAPLEDIETGTRVGIGVATGADSVFITNDENAAERDRLLPLVSTQDIAGGKIQWSGRYLINPWGPDGLVDLSDFPRLRDYYRRNEERLRSRHIAQKRPAAWFRTIDRVDPKLRSRPKLLFPDIKAASHPVLDTGELYPHHNLYYIVSDKWDLEVLGGLLLSDVANLFVGAYCVKMRGGCYRFQAQYLRQIRVPSQNELSKHQRAALRNAFRIRSVELATSAAIDAYGIEGPLALR